MTGKAKEFKVKAQGCEWDGYTKWVVYPENFTEEAKSKFALGKQDGVEYHLIEKEPVMEMMKGLIDQGTINQKCVDLIIAQDRIKGYPTGSEWGDLIRNIIQMRNNESKTTS